ncbi:ATPase family associated with various cellular activities (AAA) [Bacillus sp. ok061]|nr:ATPase family associated with various cellular activities (AAA) [Bacillus sp. ok061]
MLEDVPGTGKPLLAKTLSKSIGGNFSRFQFTPDVLPSDVTGIEYFNPKTSEFELRRGPVMTNILLADEINRVMPRTQSSLLEAMGERQVTLEKQSTPLPKAFLVIAMQNPIESQGTFPLTDAQLNRFLITISIGYPTPEDEPAKNYNWTICLSLAVNRRFGWKENLEDLISFTTYICQYATKHQIPFELFISVLAEDGVLHLSLNEDQTKYTKAVEELARISNNSTLLPKQGFLHYATRERSSTLIHISLQKGELFILSHPTFLITNEGMVEPVENLTISP